MIGQTQHTSASVVLVCQTQCCFRQCVGEQIGMLRRVGQPRAENESRDTFHLLELSLWEEHFKEPLQITFYRWR